MESVMKTCIDTYDPEFVWEDYLEETKSVAAPPTAFGHVEYSLESSFKIGMCLEVPNPEEENCYWVSSVIMICGPLLSLRYLGYKEDRSLDFWFDVKAGEFHPVGWCNNNNRKLYPPKGVRARHKDFMALLTPDLEINTIPSSLLVNPDAGVTPVDQIKVGMLIEVSDESTQNEWPARVIQNVGGRLLLRYEGSSSKGECDFWLFYLSERIHEVGWSAKPFSEYIPPFGKKINLTDMEKENLLKSVSKEAAGFPFPVHVLEPQLSVEDHEFKVGMKLEVINPATFLDIRAATVSKIINSNFFQIEVDQSSKEKDRLNYPTIYCHSGSYSIFPFNWAKEHGLRVIGREDYKEINDEDFDWDKYLTFCKASAAPADLFKKGVLHSKFEAGMKLEAVNPFFPEEIHAATVQRVVHPLLWICLDSAEVFHPHHITTAASLDIFPVGWCESNSYPLKTPLVTRQSTNSVPLCPSGSLMGSSRNSAASSQKDMACGKSWCPKIYFNHCCFTGPYLSKSRLAELPQTIGPGPLDLVMKDVLTRLINIAYKSSRVLRELQISGKPDPTMSQQTIKAKYKGKSYRATVEVVRNSAQVEEFCRKICRKLECCPHLFGPSHVGQDCPENCYILTKTKFGTGFLKRQVKAAPATAATNASDESLECKKGPGRKKKRKHWRLVNRDVANLGENWKDSPDDLKLSPKESSSHTSDSDDASTSKKSKESSPGAESKVFTRGAKSPNSELGSMQWKHHDSSSSLLLSDSKNLENFQTSEPIVKKKKGRPVGSTKKAMALAAALRCSKEVKPLDSDLEETSSSRVLKHVEQIGLPRNPVEWSLDDVCTYIRSTPCAPLARILKAQEIDGQALLMLTLHSVQEYLHLKSEPAKVLCKLVENLKYEFYTQFT